MKTQTNKQKNKQTSKIWILSFLISAFLWAGCSKDESRYPNQVAKTQKGTTGSQNQNMTESSNSVEQEIANGMLATISNLNSLSQSDFCSYYGIASNNSLTNEQKEAALEALGNSNINSMLQATHTISESMNTLPLEQILNSESSKAEILRLIFEESDVVFENWKEKPDCNAYNEEIRLIGYAWMMCHAEAMGTVNFVGVLICGVVALKAIDISNANHPECANGGNQLSSNIKSWLPASHEQKIEICNP